MTRLLLKSAAVCSWIALSAVSLVPGRYRPHTGLPKPVELVVAFFLVGLVTRFALQQTRSRLQILALVIAAVAFQLCQRRISGRSGRVSDGVASGAGAVLGVLLAKAILEPGAFGLD